MNSSSSKTIAGRCLMDMLAEMGDFFHYLKDLSKPIRLPPVEIVPPMELHSLDDGERHVTEEVLRERMEDFARRLRSKDSRTVKEFFKHLAGVKVAKSHYRAFSELIFA